MIHEQRAVRDGDIDSQTSHVFSHSHAKASARRAAHDRRAAAMISRLSLTTEVLNKEVMILEAAGKPSHL